MQASAGQVDAVFSQEVDAEIARLTTAVKSRDSRFLGDADAEGAVPTEHTLAQALQTGVWQLWQRDQRRDGGTDKDPALRLDHGVG